MDVTEIHVHDTPGQTLCGATGESISRSEALDPDDDRHFTCGACWRVLSGGQEPMGGSRP